MLKKHLFGLAMASLACSQVQAYDMKALQAQCYAYANDPQMKTFKMEVKCQPSFEDIIKETQEVTFSNENWSSAAINMKDWSTKKDTVYSQGTAQSFPCNIYKRAVISGPALSFTVSNCDFLTEEYVVERCTGLVKDACKDGQCTTSVVEVIRNTCDQYK